MLDKILATLSLAMLVAFMMVIAVYVNEPNLWVVIVVVLIMAAYDFRRGLRRDRNGPAG